MASMQNVINDYKGSTDITDEKIKALNNDYFIKGYTSTMDNMKAVAYMLDTEIWSIFAGKQAEYAIGGPTIEMLLNSYNKKYKTNYIYQATINMEHQNNIGYQVSNDNGSTWVDNIDNILDVNDSLYVKKDIDKASYMWIASPSHYYVNAYNIMAISYEGSISHRMIAMVAEGFRPVVCLKSEIGLEKQEDGTYHIVDTVRTGKITFGEPTWEGDNASVTVGTNTNFQIEYQINGVDEGIWTKIANNGTITGLKDRDTVYARLTDGTNHGEYTSINIIKGMTGAEVAENPNEYYGKTITNYTCPNSAGVSAWQIFHADENNIYLIANDYVHRNYIPKGKEGSSIRYNSDYTLAMDDVVDDYDGSSDITEEKIKELNNDYFNVKKYTSTYTNMLAVAYMLDTNVWSVFKGEQAEYAIGGPTIELLFESYNNRYGTEYVAEATSKTGYQIKKKSSDSWSNSISGMLNTTDGLYVIPSKSKASEYWLASPSAGDYTYYVSGVFYDGRVAFGTYSYDHASGFRPLVCLKSSTRITQEDNGDGYIIK